MLIKIVAVLVWLVFARLSLMFVQNSSKANEEHDKLIDTYSDIQR